MRLLKEIPRISVAFLFVLLLAVYVAAQDKKAEPQLFKHDAQIGSVYDKKKDQTTIAMDWYLVYRGLLDPKLEYPYDEEERDESDNRVYIQAAFIFPGRVIPATPEVEFRIKAGARGKGIFKVGDTPELTAIVDGEAISLGKVEVTWARTMVTTDAPRQVSVADLAARFTYAGLERITKAKKVTMKVGAFTFDLRERNLEALRDLCSRVVPSSH